MIYPTFAIGEAWKREPELIAEYDGHVQGLMNFPMYYTIQDVWGPSKKSMLQISELLEIETKLFKDVGLLGMFADNHDVDRFLHN